MRHVLVHGAGGYVGVPLCAALLDRGYHVTALDRFFFGQDKMRSLQAHDQLTMRIDDIRYFDPALLRDVDAVIDLAGLSNDPAAELDPALTQDINYRGGVRVAHLAQEYGVQRYVYSSSASVYGAGSKEGLEEVDALAPQTAYAQSKVAVEQEVLQLVGSRHFEPVILRNATIYGVAPRMRFDLAINAMTVQAWKEGSIRVLGGGTQWRPVVHVQDVVHAFLLALEAPREQVSGEIFNVGSDAQNVQIGQVAQLIAECVPHPVTICYLPGNPDNRSYHLSFRKIHDTLGYRVSMPLQEGIAELIQALAQGGIHPEDPTGYTVQWYKELLVWAPRIEALLYQGGVWKGSRAA